MGVPRGTIAVLGRAKENESGLGMCKESWVWGILFCGDWGKFLWLRSLFGC